MTLLQKKYRNNEISDGSLQAKVVTLIHNIIGPALKAKVSLANDVKAPAKYPRV